MYLYGEGEGERTSFCLNPILSCQVLILNTLELPAYDGNEYNTR